MVMNSGQGPGGSPVPRVLMMAGFVLVQLEKEKCRRRGRGMMLLLLLEEEEKRISLTVATTCGSLSFFTLLYYCCCRRAGQCEEEYTGIGSNHLVLEDFFAFILPFNAVVVVV